MTVTKIRRQPRIPLEELCALPSFYLPEGRTVLAGFSAAGVHAASFALRREIRALGFIAVAPYIREAYLEFMTERLASFPMAGLRGWVVAGEDDPVALAGPVRLSTRSGGQQSLSGSRFGPASRTSTRRTSAQNCAKLSDSSRPSSKERLRRIGFWL